MSDELTPAQISALDADLVQWRTELQADGLPVGSDRRVELVNKIAESTARLERHGARRAQTAAASEPDPLDELEDRRIQRMRSARLRGAVPGSREHELLLEDAVRSSAPEPSRENVYNEQNIKAQLRLSGGTSAHYESLAATANELKKSPMDLYALVSAAAGAATDTALTPEVLEQRIQDFGYSLDAIEEGWNRLPLSVRHLLNDKRGDRDLLRCLQKWGR